MHKFSLFNQILLSLSDVFKMVLAHPWQCCLIFKMVFKQSGMIPIRAMIQVFIFQFNLNPHNTITISLIPNIKQFTFHHTSNNQF